MVAVAEKTASVQVSAVTVADAAALSSFLQAATINISKQIEIDKTMVIFFILLVLKMNENILSGNNKS